MNHPGGGPYDLGLVPLVLGVQQLPLMIGYEGPLLDKHCEGLLISFENLDFKIIRKGLVVRLAPMKVLQMLLKG